MSGTKNVQHRSEEHMSRADLAGFLRQLADRIESGSVILTGGKKDTTLEIGEKVELEVKYQTKNKGASTKHELELEIEWGGSGGGVGLK